MQVQKKEYLVPSSASQDVREVQVLSFAHQLSIRPEGGLTAGTLLIEVRAPGSSTFSRIPGVDELDLTAAHLVPFYGVVAAYRFTATNVVGAENLVVIDTIGI